MKRVNAPPRVKPPPHLFEKADPNALIDNGSFNDDVRSAMQAMETELWREIRQQDELISSPGRNSNPPPQRNDAVHSDSLGRAKLEGNKPLHSQRDQHFSGYNGQPNMLVGEQYFTPRLDNWRPGKDISEDRVKHSAAYQRQLLDEQMAEKQRLKLEQAEEGGSRLSDSPTSNARMEKWQRRFMEDMHNQRGNQGVIGDSVGRQPAKLNAGNELGQARYSDQEKWKPSGTNQNAEGKRARAAVVSSQRAILEEQIAEKQRIKEEEKRREREADERRLRQFEEERLLAENQSRLEKERRKAELQIPLAKEANQGKRAAHNRQSNQSTDNNTENESQTDVREYDKMVSQVSEGRQMDRVAQQQDSVNMISKEHARHVPNDVSSSNSSHAVASPSKSPTVARNRLISDVYGSNSVIPGGSTVDETNANWRPSGKQVNEKNRAAAMTQREILEMQIREKQRQKEEQKKREEDEDAQRIMKFEEQKKLAEREKRELERKRAEEEAFRLRQLEQLREIQEQEARKRKGKRNNQQDDTNDRTETNDEPEMSRVDTDQALEGRHEEGREENGESRFRDDKTSYESNQLFASPSKSPTVARNRLISDVYGSNSLIPGGSAIDETNSNWRPSGKQVNEKSRAAAMTQREVLEMQIREKQRQKEEQKKREEDEDAQRIMKFEEQKKLAEREKRELERKRAEEEAFRLRQLEQLREIQEQEARKRKGKRNNQQDDTNDRTESNKKIETSRADVRQMEEGRTGKEEDNDATSFRDSQQISGRVASNDDKNVESSNATRNRNQRRYRSEDVNNNGAEEASYLDPRQYAPSTRKSHESAFGSSFRTSYTADSPGDNIDRFLQNWQANLNGKESLNMLNGAVNKESFNSSVSNYHRYINNLKLDGSVDSSVSAGGLSVGRGGRAVHGRDIGRNNYPHYFPTIQEDCDSNSIGERRITNSNHSVVSSIDAGERSLISDSRFLSVNKESDLELLTSLGLQYSTFAPPSDRKREARFAPTLPSGNPIGQKVNDLEKSLASDSIFVVSGSNARPLTAYSKEKLEERQLNEKVPSSAGKGDVHSPLSALVQTSSVASRPSSRSVDESASHSNLQHDKNYTQEGSGRAVIRSKPTSAGSRMGSAHSSRASGSRGTGRSKQAFLWPHSDNNDELDNEDSLVNNELLVLPASDLESRPVSSRNSRIYGDSGVYSESGNISKPGSAVQSSRPLTGPMKREQSAPIALSPRPLSRPLSRPQSFPEYQQTSSRPTSNAFKVSRPESKANPSELSRNHSRGTCSSGDYGHGEFDDYVSDVDHNPPDDDDLHVDQGAEEMEEEELQLNRYLASMDRIEDDLASSENKLVAYASKYSKIPHLERVANKFPDDYLDLAAVQSGNFGDDNSVDNGVSSFARDTAEVNEVPEEQEPPLVSEKDRSRIQSREAQQVSSASDSGKSSRQMHHDRSAVSVMTDYSQQSQYSQGYERDFLKSNESSRASLQTGSDLNGGRYSRGSGPGTGTGGRRLSARSNRSGQDMEYSGDFEDHDSVPGLGRNQHVDDSYGHYFD